MDGRLSEEEEERYCVCFCFYISENLNVVFSAEMSDGSTCWSPLMRDSAGSTCWSLTWAITDNHCQYLESICCCYCCCPAVLRERIFTNFGVMNAHFWLLLFFCFCSLILCDSTIRPLPRLDIVFIFERDIECVVALRILMGFILIISFLSHSAI